MYVCVCMYVCIYVGRYVCMYVSMCIYLCISCTIIIKGLSRRRRNVPSPVFIFK